MKNEPISLQHRTTTIRMKIELKELKNTHVTKSPTFRFLSVYIYRGNFMALAKNNYTHLVIELHFGE